jgi:histidine triad (HIT) family protein
MVNRPAGCVFCEIVGGRAPAHRVGENGRALAILDIQPFAPGHALVLSKRHVPVWHDLTPREAADVFALAHKLAGKLRRVFEPEFVCLMARGRRIPHTHVFLVPTRPGDVLDRYFNGLGDMQEASEELAHLRELSSRDEAARRLHGRRRVRSRRPAGVRRRNARPHPRGAGR